MGRRCSVENCVSDSTKPEHTGVTFHKIPLHPGIRSKWLLLCRIPDEKNLSKLLYVCSRHFLRVDFCSFKGKKYMLKQGVLPSVFPWDKSKLDAIKAEVITTIIKKDDNNSPKKQETTTIINRELLPPKREKVIETLFLDIKMSPKKEEDKIISNETVEKNVVEVKSELSSYSSIEPLLQSSSSVSSAKVDHFDQHQITQTTSSSVVDTTTTNTTNNSSLNNFTINSEIQVLDNNSNKWHKAEITEIDYQENELLVQFNKSLNNREEWIPMSSSRIRSKHFKELIKGNKEFSVGERCMAVWADIKKFPATVSKKLDNDMYEVLFDDGYNKVLKSQKMSKMSVAKVAKSSPLFEPIKSSKQERRDKKRKINVAQLFSKRSRATNVGEESKKGKINSTVTSTLQNLEESCPSPASQDESTVISTTVTPRWHPSWANGKPIGADSTIETADGLRKSVIVPDPRLPSGWTKHLSKRVYGNSVGKWDTIILSPDGKKFRSRQDVKNYLDIHPSVEATLEMFDFSLYGGAGKKRGGKLSANKLSKDVSLKLPLVEETTIVEESAAVIKEEVLEEPSNTLKILYEDNSFKCPIDGCGKISRREDLALMHVKHYHSEYTKYLNSTPNVADLAYARTVGENLRRSSLGTLNNNKSATTTTKSITKSQKSATIIMDHTSSLSLESSKQQKDTEIIKLLNQKLSDTSSGSSSEVQQQFPPGLPSNQYPDINLKDLLANSDNICCKKDDINIKNICSARPSPGIKTLLPVRHAIPSGVDVADEKPPSKRKKGQNVLLDADSSNNKDKTPYRRTFESSSSLQHHPSSSITPSNSDNHNLGQPIPSAFDLAPPPAGLDSFQAPTVTQFDGVIIEGGKIIKLERMKQEEIINCTCGFTEEDGLMIQCELCLCWQHAYCNNILKESEVPEKYICYICQHPAKERHAAKYLHDQDWLKQGILPVGSYHTKDKQLLEERFEKLKKCHDISGSLLELKEYFHSIGKKLKIAEAKNHPKLYLWSKPWEKQKLPEKCGIKIEKSELDESSDPNQQYVREGSGNDSMLMMILKGGKEEIPMLNNMQINDAPIIPKPEEAIDSDVCRLNLLEHISHSESLVEERLDDFEKQMDLLEAGLNIESEEDYPRMRQTIQHLMRDLNTLKKFSQLPVI